VRQSIGDGVAVISHWPSCRYHKAAEGAELAQREFEYAQKNMLLEAKERQRIESALKV
jgi:hypothetical protein